MSISTAITISTLDKFQIHNNISFQKKFPPLLFRHNFMQLRLEHLRKNFTVNSNQFQTLFHLFIKMNRL